jgi:uncharacterized protein YcgL (UPF0745 family)
MNNKQSDQSPVPCTVWRSIKREYTYLYLHEDREFEDLPTPLRALFAGAEPAMELDLAARSTLANADIEQVRKQLEDPGYYLQLPPEDDPSGWLDLPSKPA